MKNLNKIGGAFSITLWLLDQNCMRNVIDSNTNLYQPVHTMVETVPKFKFRELGGLIESRFEVVIDD